VRSPDSSSTEPFPNDTRPRLDPSRFLRAQRASQSPIVIRENVPLPPGHGRLRTLRRALWHDLADAQAFAR